MPPTFESNPQDRYKIERDLEQQIHFAYRNLVNRIEGLADELADAVVLAVSNGEPAVARLLAPFAEQLKDCHGKNIKLKTKMEAAGLGQ